ncbi:MAG: glycosyltransferase, partial [Bacteroidota bacterium]
DDDVIVNYNVRYFLEQCLRSVEKAIQDVQAEVWVVDNNSADDSVSMVEELFPWVKLIANEDDPGFSIANNQAIRQSTGKYALLLNPDTLVEEDTFQKCLAFMEAHPKAGALGVRMIDGSGRFLPESKRGLPTPWVAFTKAFGLARLFPKSKLFNQYHLGYLPEHDTGEVPVLAGAYMWLRREALDKVGLLDETFFMYGEDIDLSYRITEGGYQNYYFPATTIIHYKGESTKRGSLNYVRTFYQAMIIFAKKHFTGGAMRSLVGLMSFAIYVRAAMTIASNFWKRLYLPILDAIGIYLGLVLLKSTWAQYRFEDVNYYDSDILWQHFPAYTVMWLLGIFLNGGYDRPFELRRLARGLGISTLILTTAYGLLPLELRPSRALLLLGAVWAGIWTFGLRLTVHAFKFGHFRLGTNDRRRLLIVGSVEETERVLRLLQRAGVTRNYLGRVATTTEDEQKRLGLAEQLAELARLYRAEEIIFCSADLPVAKIQRWMAALGPQIFYKILPEASSSIIGSHRADRRGTLYTIDVNLRIDEPVHRRSKWLFDKGMALLLFLTWPLSLWLVRDKLGLLINAFRVLKGDRGWVGYDPRDQKSHLLPTIRGGIVSPAVGDVSGLDADSLHHLNLLYARDYRVGDDLRLVWEQRRKLGD